MKKAKYVGIGGTVLTKKQYEICMKCDYCYVSQTGHCDKINFKKKRWK